MGGFHVVALKFVVECCMLDLNGYHVFEFVFNRSLVYCCNHLCGGYVYVCYSFLDSTLI